MNPRERRARDIQQQIAQILLHAWDPIGVSGEPLARSEYDSCVGGVYRLLATGATEDQIIEHLRAIDPTGEPSLSASPLRSVARQLHSLDVTLWPGIPSAQQLLAGDEGRGILSE